MLLSYITWNLRPQIFKLDSFELRYYSLMFGLGFIIAYYLLAKMYKREGVSLELLDKLTMYMILATIIGARLGHCIFYEPETYLLHPLKIILPFEGKIGQDFRFTGYQGLASHGGGIGILIGLYLYCRKYKITYLWILDRIAIVTALVGTFIRMGNFFNSEINGIPTDLPWGVKFMRAWDQYDAAAGEVLPKHPAQLYEALAYLLIFVLLTYLYNKRHQLVKQGYFIGLFLILVFSARFFIEFVKDIQVDFEQGMTLNMGQWLSIPFIISGIYLLRRKAPVGKPFKGKK
ncbi:MAG: prolipoprotein diacylglyceryl transferase [Bacteroidales bacterium]|nr:prolipoprotein diacylglyceryl transferase [Bacteroidales bacterium]MBN2819536.1 prolipoprotein diacylglyceryl transferase [Bacteroidales bacterium]